MCTHACLEFARAHLRPEDVHGRAVIEVGSLDVNGSVRPLVEALRPASYLGVDMQPGPNVDQVCDATELVARFGAEAFDLLISTEVLEHVRDWRRVISQFKRMVKPGGRLLVTTRSRGFAYHAYPHDFWRYEPSDIKSIFSDFELEVLERDPQSPGVFFRARKPEHFVEKDTREHGLFSIISGRETLTITDAEIAAFHRRGKVQRVLKKPERLARRLRDKLRP